MKGSTLPYLDAINTVILCAGHGQGDPGAVNGNRFESNENIWIVDRATEYLRSKGVNVVVVPHSLGLSSSIAWVNERYKTLESAWAIEIHRDMNAPEVPEDRRDNQMGIYYWGDANGDNNNSDDDVNSRAIADYLLEKFLSYGAAQGTENRRDFDGSWAKDHYIEWSNFHLGWVNNTKPLSHLIECGYMSGRGDQEHLTKLGQWVGQAIYEAFTGQSTQENTQTDAMLKDKMIAAVDKAAQDGRIDGTTREALVNSVLNEDMTYFSEYSGFSVREELDTVNESIPKSIAKTINNYEAEIEELESKISALNSELVKLTSDEADEGMTANVIEPVSTFALPDNALINHFTERSPQLKMILGILKNDIFPILAAAIGTLTVSGQIESPWGWVAAIGSAIGSAALELDKTSYNEREKNNQE